MKGWLNGRLVEAGAPALRLDERGFTLGDGLFETLAVRDGRPQHLEPHLLRLAEGAALLRLPLPPRERLEQALRETLRANDLTAGVLRLTLTRGHSRRGIEPEPGAEPTLAVTAAPPPPPPPPARLIVAGGMRRDEGSPLSRVKALAYLPSVLARLEARAAGADEALLPNTAGRIASATVANVFLLAGGRVVTPPLSDGPLPGIARGVILAAGLAEEAPLEAALLAEAEALVLTNSLSLRPASALAGRPLDLAAGQALAARFAEALVREAIA